MTPEHRSLTGEINARVGRNIIRVQSLERGLKTLVPLMDLQGKSHCFDGWGDRSNQAAKNTLGQLVGCFLRSGSSNDPRLTEMFERIVKDRNDLVHHFHDALEPLMSTAEGCIQAKEQLDKQFELIKLFEKLVHELLITVFHAIRDITFKGTPEQEGFALLCEKLSVQFQAASLADARIETRQVGGNG